MGLPDFRRLAPYPAHPVSHALHDDNVDVVDGDVVKAVDDGLQIEPAAEPKPALPLGCRWRVPLTWVNNVSDVP